MAIGAAIASAVISVGSSFLGGQAQKKAIQESSEAAIAEQRRQFDIAQGFTEPRREAETAALTQLQNILGIGTEQVDLSGLQIPGQQFQIDEASRAIERSAAARGGLVSGGTLAELQSRALGITQQNFLSNFLNPLQNLALGSANQQAGQQAIGLGVNVGNILGGAGINRANILGTQFAGINKGLQGGIKNLFGAGAFGGGTGGGNLFGGGK